MNRLSRNILTLAILLLLSPALVLGGFYLYGYYRVHLAEKQRDAIDKQQAFAAGSGNGFGGDVGMEILDSGFRSKKFFWIDNDRLVFRTNYNAAEPKGTQRQYVWDTREHLIKPLVIDGNISSFFDGKLYYARVSESRVLPNGRKDADIYQSALRELEDRWVVEGSVNIASIFETPSERYELRWYDGRPRHRIKPELRVESDVPKHRFEYLWEWGWIFRKPWYDPVHYYQNVPEIGFFDLSGEVYADQPGRKVADLVKVHPAELINLKFVYLGFLDRFWIASNFYGGGPKEQYMAIMDRTGELRELEWPANWPEYAGIPLPTRKGMLWSGQDFRLAEPTIYDRGLFLNGKEGHLHKASMGSALRSQLSKDGCRVAFFNPPRPDRGADASLKVFNICKSTMDGRELADVDY